jgi:hypothetical protein
MAKATLDLNPLSQLGNANLKATTMAWKLFLHLLKFVTKLSFASVVAAGLCSLQYPHHYGSDTCSQHNGMQTSCQSQSVYLFKFFNECIWRVGSQSCEASPASISFYLILIVALATSAVCAPAFLVIDRVMNYVLSGGSECSYEGNYSYQYIYRGQLHQLHRDAFLLFSPLLVSPPKSTSPLASPIRSPASVSKLGMPNGSVFPIDIQDHIDDKIQHICDYLCELRAQCISKNLHEDWNSLRLQWGGENLSTRPNEEKLNVSKIDIDDVNLRNKLGRETSTNNPCFARAYKGNFEEMRKQYSDEEKQQIENL